MRKRESGVFLRKTIIRSKAFKKLTKTEILILLEFLLKRTFGQRKNKPGKITGDIVTNNGQITFTYAEAMKRLGIASQTVQRSFDKLLEVGFIDIAKQGKGGIIENGKITGEATLFGVSERWSDYGTEQFIVKTRQKDDRQGRGWAAYHAKRKRMKEGR